MTVEELLANDQYAKFTGVELLEVKEGYAKARMEIKPMHLNGGGVCQGGAIFTLADLAFAAVTNSHGELTVSVHSGINFFRAEKEGYLYATAREVYDHKRICNCEVQVTNEKGELVATFTGTGYHKGIKIDKI